MVCFRRMSVLYFSSQSIIEATLQRNHEPEIIIEGFINIQ
jgi:hypothetical protein